MTVTRADLERVVRAGPHIEGYAERLAAYDGPDLAGFLRAEFGTGGCSFPAADGSRGYAEWRPGKGVRVEDFLDRDQGVSASWRQVAEIVSDSQDALF